MKKVIFSIGILLLGTISFAQTCFNSFEVLNNGNGQGNGCPSSTFPGYLSQPPSAAHPRSGKIELRFSTPLPTGVTPPEITKVRKILTPSPNMTYGPYLDFKFSFLQFIGVGRTITEYCYYADGDLDNGSGARYEVEVKYDATGGNGTSTCVIIQTADPIALPVHFKSFNASRTNSSSVSITWITASEQNSRGFNVQKNVAGEWKTIAFVFSQTEDGNSSSDLSYSFKDANTEKGITQYRIQQVDLDGKTKYSDIKVIKGESTASKIVVYPNPSVDGKVNVVFEDTNVRDIQVNDMQGRIVKSFRGITNNILVIEKLTSGFYTIKITNRNTAVSSVEKVVVK